jgi:hypothetical protein
VVANYVGKEVGGALKVETHSGRDLKALYLAYAHLALVPYPGGEAVPDLLDPYAVPQAAAQWSSASAP